MNLQEVLRQLDNAMVVAELKGDQLHLRAVLDERPLDPEIIGICREHKTELLNYVAWEQEADAAHYPYRCHALESDPTWDAFEHELRDAYTRQDHAALLDVIARREAYALDIFAAWERERAA